MSKLRKRLLIAEVIICFALPAYMLFWGVVSIPVWVDVVLRHGTYAIWNLASIAGGCLGVVAIIAFVRYLTSSDERRFAVVRNSVMALAGLVAVWSIATDKFTSFGLDPFTLIGAAVPTLCFTHLAALTIRRLSAGRLLVRPSAGAGVD
jgi:hypothetical protein